MSSPFTTGMREDHRALVLEWGKNTVVSRFVSVVVAGGRESGSFVSSATEIMWVQPIGGFSDIKEQGLDEATTHLLFQYWSGYTVQAKDRILPSGETFRYDVIRSNLKESHRVSELKQVRRT